MSLINSQTRKQISALEMRNLEIKYTPNTNYVEVSSRKKDFSATITTPQVRRPPPLRNFRICTLVHIPWVWREVLPVGDLRWGAMMRNTGKAAGCNSICGQHFWGIGQRREED